MRKALFSRYNVADYLTNSAEIAAYLEAAKEENDPALLAAAMEDIRQIAESTDQQRTKTNPLRGQRPRPQAKPTA